MTSPLAQSIAGLHIGHSPQCTIYANSRPCDCRVSARIALLAADIDAALLRAAQAGIDHGIAFGICVGDEPDHAAIVAELEPKP